MDQVVACIDGQTNTTTVVDWAIWSARRLDTPLAFLHALERHPERVDLGDYSGALGMGAQESLLQSLSELDEKQGRLAQESGRQLLAAARQRAESAGLSRIDERLRHGELIDTVLELEPAARLFVLGEHFRSSGAARLHLDHHVERVIRSVARPALVATGSRFVAPQRFLIAFDGSPTAKKAVTMVAASPLLAGLPVLLAMAGHSTPQAVQQLGEAKRTLQDAGFDVATELVNGDVETVIPRLVDSHSADLLVIGAYGHSRLRQLIVGSTTTTLLRISEVPVLVLR
ncbi:universal stress protein [Piscinibacter sakaiensis]|uniref:universal stress protein n=1 Tax=Piscinibacter sakaiensis TaxID=1547922 RepID=UPI003AB01140